LNRYYKHLPERTATWQLPVTRAREWPTLDMATNLQNVTLPNGCDMAH